MHRGYIRLWRKSEESRAFQNAELWKVWTWCLMQANHKGKWVPVKTGKGETEIYVESGQFIFGRKTAAKKLKMKPSSVRDRIKKLRDMQNLTTQPNTHYTIISICNWREYQPDQKQQDDRQPDNQTTTTRQPDDNHPTQPIMDKNDKNDKNNGQKKITPELIQKLKQEYPNIDIEFEYEKYTHNQEEKPKSKKHKNQQRGFRNWVKQANMWSKEKYQNLSNIDEWEPPDER